MEKAKKVRRGKSPKASSHNKLAERVNGLISSGAGDPAWRIFYYAHSMFRQPRNPHVGIFNALGMWPSGDEWWTFYAHFELPLFKDGVARVGLSWPKVLAGFPEGANVVNPICKFTFGHKIYKGYWWGAIGLWSEGNNFSTHLIGVSPGLYTNNHFWNQAKTQRGAMFISGKDNAEINAGIRACTNTKIPRSAANRIVERRINVSSSLFSVARRPYDQILSQGLLYQLYAPAVVKGYKIWKRGTSDEHMSNYYKTYKAAKGSGWGSQVGMSDATFSDVKMVTPVLHRKYASQQIFQSIFHYLITFRGSEHQRALFCRSIKKNTFETAIFDTTTSADYQYNNYPFLKKISTEGDPISVCDVGFDFQDFLSRQYILAPAYGEGEAMVTPNSTGGATYPKLKTVRKKGVNRTNISVIKIDKEGYPRIRGSFGDATPTYHLDKSFRNSEGALKIEAGATIAMTNDNGDFKNGKNQFTLVDNRSPSQWHINGGKSGPVFNTNPWSKDRNAFCFAGYYIYFVGVTNTDFQCRIIIRKLVGGKWKEVEEVRINSRTSYFVQTNLASVGETSKPKTYNIYSKLDYFRRGLKGKFDFLLMPYNKGGTMVDFGKYDKDELNHFSEIQIRIEMAHLYDMRPTILDAYAFLRVATTKGGVGGKFAETEGNPDSVGHDYSEAKVISSNYAKFGSAVNPHGAQVVPNAQLYLNNNPIYEATRKFVTSNMKMVPRNNVVNYAEERGKGVLYLDRFAMGMANTGIDMFRGMGPAIDSAGWFDKYHFDNGKSAHVTYVPIMPGKLYYVWSHEEKHKGSVVYNGGDPLTHGKKFVGKAGVDYLDKKDNRVGVYETEGIRRQTPSGFESNEWVMFMTFNPYHWSESNIWKPSIFGDQTCFLHNRCLFKAPDIEGNFRSSSHYLSKARTEEASMMRDTFYNFNTRTHLGIGDMSTYVQAPPKFNTWKGYNAPMEADNLASEEALGWTESCRLKTKMYKITSVTRFFGSRGKVGDPRVNLIRVELNEPLENGKNPSMPIGGGPYDGSYCDVARVMKKQKYRSDKNGLVEYINSGRGGSGYQCGTKFYEKRNGVMIGDYGANLDLAKEVGSKTGGYSIFGSCHPRFYFLKLIPEVSEGAQLKVDPYVQMEYYIRAMHGGYVDTKGDMQFKSFLPGTDVANSDLMQSSVDHDMDSLATSVDNSPDVVTTDTDPENITPSSRG